MAAADESAKMMPADEFFRLMRSVSTVETVKDPAVCKDVGVATWDNKMVREQMEDEHSTLTNVKANAPCDFLSVFDGHGGRTPATIAKEVFEAFIQKDTLNVK